MTATSMLDRGAGDTILVPPGRSIVAATGMNIYADLGASVAVCLWDRARRVGGVVHLPGRDADPADGMIQRVVDGLVALGAQPATLEATVLGPDPELVDPLRRLLAEHGVPLVDWRTGDLRGRRAMFATWTGTIVLGSTEIEEPLVL